MVQWGMVLRFWCSTKVHLNTTSYGYLTWNANFLSTVRRSPTLRNFSFESNLKEKQQYCLHHRMFCEKFSLFFLFFLCLLCCPVHNAMRKQADKKRTSKSSWFFFCNHIKYSRKESKLIYRIFSFAFCLLILYSPSCLFLPWKIKFPFQSFCNMLKISKSQLNISSKCQSVKETSISLSVKHYSFTIFHK